jgi:hypothetical protein
LLAFKTQFTYHTHSADLTACGRFINPAKTSEGPVSAKAEAGFLLSADLSTNLQGGIPNTAKAGILPSSTRAVLLYYGSKEKDNG